jgi:predicted MFS family arabinose efflux permease
LGWEAPSRIRGAAAGVFNVVGTFGILFATLVGGEVFDRIGYTAPFTMMAIVNGVVALVALTIYLRFGNSAATNAN